MTNARPSETRDAAISDSTGGEAVAARYVTTIDDLELTASNRADGSWLDQLSWILLALMLVAVGAMGYWYRRVRNRTT